MAGIGTILDCINVVFGLVHDHERSALLIESAREALHKAPSLSSEFGIIKRQFFARAREWHPDKNSADNANDTFRRIQGSFEALRDLFERGTISSFLSDNVLSTIVEGDFGSPHYEDENDTTAASRRARRRPQPWEYFAAAEELDEPLYRVELAKSGRSRCTATGRAQRCKQETVKRAGRVKIVGEVIGEGEVRIGSYDVHSGKYGLWRHVSGHFTYSRFPFYAIVSHAFIVAAFSFVFDDLHFFSSQILVFIAL